MLAVARNAISLPDSNCLELGLYRMVYSISSCNASVLPVAHCGILYMALLTNVRVSSEIAVRSGVHMSGLGDWVWGQCWPQVCIFGKCDLSSFGVWMSAGLRLQCKYKGHSNRNTQIRASFSEDGNSIVCGSDDGYVYVWNREITASQAASKKVSIHDFDHHGLLCVSC